MASPKKRTGCPAYFEARQDLVWRMIADQADGAHRLLTSWRSGLGTGPAAGEPVSWA